MTVNLSWEETFTIFNLNFPTSHEILVIVFNEFETKSDIDTLLHNVSKQTKRALGILRCSHAYINNWKPIIGENLQTCPEPDNIMNKYAVAVLKDTQVVGHLTKGKSERCAKTVFYSFELTSRILQLLRSKGGELIC